VKITFQDFAGLAEPVHVVVHSLDQALYQVTLEVDGKQLLLVEDDGRTFRRHSLQQVREALHRLPVASLRLRHESAYDEMIGQPLREGTNALEVTLSLDQYPLPQIH
jgi:hypothetical protein